MADAAALHVRVYGEPGGVRLGASRVSQVGALSQAMWIGFAPIEVDVMKDYGVSSTYVNFLSLVFMIVARAAD